MLRRSGKASPARSVHGHAGIDFHAVVVDDSSLNAQAGRADGFLILWDDPPIHDTGVIVQARGTPRGFMFW